MANDELSWTDSLVAGFSLTCVAGFDLNLSSIDFCIDALSAGSSLLSPELEVELVAGSEHPPSGRRPASMAITKNFPRQVLRSYQR